MAKSITATQRAMVLDRMRWLADNAEYHRVHGQPGYFHITTDHVYEVLTVVAAIEAEREGAWRERADAKLETIVAKTQIRALENMIEGRDNTIKALTTRLEMLESERRHDQQPEVST